MNQENPDIRSAHLPFSLADDHDDGENDENRDTIPCPPPDFQDMDDGNPAGEYAAILMRSILRPNQPPSILSFPAGL